MEKKRKIKVYGAEVEIDKKYELDFNRAASFVKWQRVSIPMAVATVTGDVTEALYLIKKLREAF